MFTWKCETCDDINLLEQLVNHRTLSIEELRNLGCNSAFLDAIDGDSAQARIRKLKLLLMVTPLKQLMMTVYKLMIRKLKLPRMTLMKQPEQILTA